MSGTDDKLKGKLEETKGRGQQAWGDLTDDPDTKAVGEREEMKGEGRQALGGLKDKAEDVKDAAKDKFDKDKP